MPPITPEQQMLAKERSEILQQLEDWLETPMMFLSFGWLALFVVELIWGLNSFLDAVGIAIWIAFILDFGLKLVLAHHKVSYLRRNWLTALSLFLPALRTFRIFRVVRSLQSVRAVRGLRLLRMMTRTNQGMQVLGASFGRRGFGYVAALSTIMTLVGAAGIYAFEHQSPNSAIDSYGTALWWAAMLMTTIGSDYFPQSPEGRILCFLLALYASAVFGYLTAAIATFFIGRDADDSEAEISGEKSVQALQAEIAALRVDIQALSRSQIEHDT